MKDSANCCDNNACETQLAEKTAASTQRYRTPVYDVKNVENGYEIAIEVPGVAKEGVEVVMAGENLVITANKLPAPSSWKPVKLNTSPENYRLPLRVTVPLETANITAKVENGILTVKLPLATSSLPRTIEVA